jgi:hypothetical protein
METKGTRLQGAMDCLVRLRSACVCVCVRVCVWEGMSSLFVVCTGRVQVSVNRLNTHRRAQKNVDAPRLPLALPKPLLLRLLLRRPLSVAPTAAAVPLPRS